MPNAATYSQRRGHDGAFGTLSAPPRTVTAASRTVFGVGRGHNAKCSPARPRLWVQASSDAELPKGLLAAVMVNFICQLDRVMGCPDAWSNVILGIPVRVFFWMRLTFKSVD